MFCKNCGAQINDGAAFCPSCGAQQGAGDPNANSVPQNQFANQQQGQGYGSDMSALLSNDVVATYLPKLLVAVAAIIFGLQALLSLIRIVERLDYMTTTFSSFDGAGSALATLGFVACGLVMALFAAIAASPLIRVLMDESVPMQGAVDRSLVYGGTFFAICIAVWVCDLVFKDTTGDISIALSTIFDIYGYLATSFFVATIVALVILYILRAKLLIKRA